MGINRAEKKAVTPAAAPAPAPVPAQENVTESTVPAGAHTEVIQTKVEKAEEPVVPEPAAEETSPATPLLPMVSSPF